MSPDEVDALQKRRKAAQQELQGLEQQLKQHILCDVQKHCLLSDRNEVILQMADEAGAQTLKKTSVKCGRLRICQSGCSSAYWMEPKVKPIRKTGVIS